MKKFYILPLALLLGSCASMQQAYIQQNCNHDAAYSQGMNDARSGAPMSAQSGQSCPPETLAAVQGGYREGYTAGLSSMQPTSNSGGGSLINVNIGGGGESTPSPRAWFCEASAFTDHFQSFGPTQLEAQQNVLGQCRAKYDAMFCKQANCRMNQ